jgi:C1A family cysteine protease
MAFSLGYRRDPTRGYGANGQVVDLIARDRDFSEKLKPYLVSATDGDVDLSPYTTETNQLNVSACAGNATADSIEAVGAIDEENRAKAEGRAPVVLPQLSRLFIYSMAREIIDTDRDGVGDLDQDEGTYIRLCFDILRRFGICKETTWPYDVNKVHAPPSFMAMREATGHHLHSYYRIKSEGDGRLEDIVAALRGRHPVVFGTQINQEFLDGGGPTVIDRPTGTTIGGHAMMLVGYVGGNFKVKNSWGATWKDGGFCYFTPAYLSWSGTSDLWVPTSGTVFG